MEKIKANIGIVTAIFDLEGKLLLRKRTEHDSITGEDYFGNWELPAVAAMESKKKSIPYNYLVQGLVKGVERETGIKITANSVDPMPAFYPVAFKTKEGNYDIAMITIFDRIIVLPSAEKLEQKQSNGELIFISTQELNDIASEFISATDAKKEGKKAKGLLSGFGKRQHCMALKAIEVGSSNPRYRAQAKRTLRGIQQNWK